MKDTLSQYLGFIVATLAILPFAPKAFIASRAMFIHCFRLLIFACIVGLCNACGSPSSAIPAIDLKMFDDYWNQGKAEISSYDLHQSCYDTNYDGRAVLIFVTEDMSNSKQVKLDHPSMYSSDAVNVMKMNTNKEFITGINKYSMMSSVFTPLDDDEHPHSLKLTAGIQDWNGQSFMQFNFKGNRYEIQQMSCFESDGDQALSLLVTWLEDEIWTKIRVAPNTLPIGNFTMIPSAFYICLSHQPEKVYDASASLKLENNEYAYIIHYPDLERTLEINFQMVFPYKILGWKEAYGKNKVTTARISTTILSDYWKHNRPEDKALREELNLNN